MTLSLRKLCTAIAKAQLLLWLSFGLCISAFALTAPGTILYNSAQLSYDDAQINKQIRSDSNTASVSVGRQYLFTVENQHQLEVDAGVVARFPHRIKNVGNADDSYRFDYDNVDVDAFDTPMIILDVNGNGILDPNEPVIESTPVVQAQEFVDVIVLSRVAASLSAGIEKEFQFSVLSEQTNQTKALSNTVTVGQSGDLEITLNTLPECSTTLFPGDIVTHSVEVRKKGYRALQTATYLLDGQNVEGLVYEIPVSENNHYLGFSESGSASVPGVQVVKLASSASGEWMSVSALPEEDVELEPITSAGFFVASDELGVGETASFAVQTQVDERFFDNTNVSRTAFIDPDSDGIADIQSNSTCNTFSSIQAAQPGAIAFIEPVSSLRDAGRAPDFTKATDFKTARQFSMKRNESDSYTAFRDGVYLELSVEDTNHPDIQINSAGQRYATTTLSSELTGDSVQIVMLETSTPGVFRSVAPITLSTYERSDGGMCPTKESGTPIREVYENLNPGCVLESRDNDRLLALFGDSDSGFSVSGSVLVTRQSFIFDTHTLDPIEGAIVQIMLEDDGLFGDPIAVDSVTGAEFEFVTDAGGRFAMPRLADSARYYLNVIPPLGYSFPSKVLPFRLTDFTVHGFSYGREGIVLGDSTSGIFTGAQINARRSFDIPLDLSGVGSLLAVDKVAVQTVVDVGQSVSYVVTIKNSSDKDLEQVVVDDIVPFGFRYVEGTTVLARQPVSDPSRTESGALAFEVGTIVANESVILSYSLRATAAALDGDGVNTAVATGYTSTRQVTKSLPGRARVTLQRSGVMSNKASLFGKVYVDQNCDGVQNNKEWPIGGVRLYLQDGTYAITDNDGQYSVYGLEPGLYVVKVDEYTLPEGLDLKLLSVDQVADASSQFVNLTEGDWHKVDFAASCPEKNVDRIFSEIEQRNRSFDSAWYLQQAENFNTLDEEPADNPQLRMSTPDGDVSNGLLEGPIASDASSEMNQNRDSSGQASSKGRVANTQRDQKDASALQISVEKIDAKKVIATVTSEQAKSGSWLWPTDGVSLNGRFMAVVRAGIEPTLYVNDVAIPSTNLGERLLNKREKAQVVAWYGVELNAGENLVQIKGNDPFGNERVLATGVFKRPSSGSQIKIRAQADTVPADSGRSQLPVTVEILDDNGYRALGVYYITLESDDGEWVEPDIQDAEPGRQIRIENGFRTLHYRPSGTAGEVRIAAHTDEFADEITIYQVPEVRPLIVSGYVEAGAFTSAKDFGNFSPSTDLGSLASEKGFESRAALFLKGTVKKDYNLTLSYDSDKTDERELLRDINPVLHYPVHGDAAIKGFEAQSRSKLYVRVERDKNSVMWGDFLTDPSSDARDLAQINRALTGFNGVLHKGKNSLRVFAAEANNQNISEQIPGNGSALLYRLQRYPIVPNSEIVELVTRSRENPGLILDSVRLSRLGDYTVDDDLGYLSFAASIPTLDGEQNPVFIRVTYDVSGDGDDYLISGVRFDRQVSENVKIGASLTDDAHITEGTRLIGAYGDFKLGRKTRLSASIASSDSVHKGRGAAHSLSLDHQWSGRGAGLTTLTRVHADEGFNNLGAAAAAGRTETTLQHSQNLNFRPNTRLVLDANSSDSAVMNDGRRSFGAVIDTHYKSWQVRTGLRQNFHKSDSVDEDFVTAELGLRRKINVFGRSGEGSFEIEQDVGLAQRRRVTVGGKVNLHTDVRAYANYELSNSLLGFNNSTGSSESESFVLGVESKRLKSTRLYSEYRVRDAFDSRGYETASGIRGDYAIVKGLVVNPQFEYIRRFGSEGDSFSASVGITDTRHVNSRKLLRVETRQSKESDHYGLRASVATRINNDWTAMVSDNLSRQEIVGADSVLRHTFTAALARRPKHDNKHHMLFMYRLRQEGGVIDDLDRSTHVLSTHQNVQLSRKTEISGRLGVKRDSSKFNNNTVTDHSILLDSRFNYDIDRRTSIEINMGSLSTDGVSETRYSFGLGLNYTINKNARLSVGYNLIGFRDDELDSENFNAEGARIALQYKLDEDLFKWLK